MTTPSEPMRDGATPRPWWLFSGKDFVYVIHEETGDLIVEMGTRKKSRANATLIVRAVNNHKALLAACKTFTRQLQIEQCPKCGGSGLFDKFDACHRCGGVGEIVEGSLHPDDLIAARAAIAAAEREAK